MEEILKKLSLNLGNIINHFKNDIYSIRSSKVSHQLVENIVVVYAEQKFLIKQLASISVLPPSTILISPWDKIYLETIAKTIASSALGINPVTEGNTIKLMVPSLTEEKRIELVKLVKAKSEETKIIIRRERDEALKNIKEMEKDKKISEDLKFKAKEKIQKEIDEANKKIDQLVKEKEKEIMKV